MLNLGRNKKRGNQRNLLGALNKYCFAAIFCLSILGQCSVAFFLSHKQDTKLSAGKIFVGNGSGHTLHFSLNFPIGIEPDNDEAGKDETAAGHDVDLLLWDSAPGNAFRYSVEKTSFSNFISSIENRKPVSLIILHHSWKSFLS